MKKRIILSLLQEDKPFMKQVGTELVKAGLDVAAHIWDPELKNGAWTTFVTESVNASAWVIAGNIGDNADLKKSLSLAALSVQHREGYGYPIFYVPSGDMKNISLPTPLLGAEVVQKNFGSKCAVQAQFKKKMAIPYRFRPIFLSNGLGLWFEIGPNEDNWEGAFFACGGTSEKAVPNFHGVGAKEFLPENCTLDYPIKDVKLSVAETECLGWGVKNTITPADSYFVRVGDTPDIVSFGSFPDTDDCELYTVKLC